MLNLWLPYFLVNSGAKCIFFGHYGFVGGHHAIYLASFFFFDVGGAFLVCLVGISMVINVKVVETFVKRVFPAQASARMCGTRKLTVFFLAV